MTLGKTCLWARKQGPLFPGGVGKKQAISKLPSRPHACRIPWASVSLSFRWVDRICHCLPSFTLALWKLRHWVVLRLEGGVALPLIAKCLPAGAKATGLP